MSEPSGPPSCQPPNRTVHMPGGSLRRAPPGDAGTRVATDAPELGTATTAPPPRMLGAAGGRAVGDLSRRSASEPARAPGALVARGVGGGLGREDVGLRAS